MEIRAIGRLGEENLLPVEVVRFLEGVMKGEVFCGEGIVESAENFDGRVDIFSKQLDLALEMAMMRGGEIGEEEAKMILGLYRAVGKKIEKNDFETAGSCREMQKKFRGNALEVRKGIFDSEKKVEVIGLLNQGIEFVKKQAQFGELSYLDLMVNLILENGDAIDVEIVAKLGELVREIEAKRFFLDRRDVEDVSDEIRGDLGM